MARTIYFAYPDHMVGFALKCVIVTDYEELVKSLDLGDLFGQVFTPRIVKVRRPATWLRGCSYTAYCAWRREFLLWQGENYPGGNRQ